MAGMKRFVTYIYSYENEKKGGNAGFAKIDIRGNECRIEIHLRGISIGRMLCRVYLFRPEGDEIVGFPIGEISVQKGAGDFKARIKAARIAGSDLGISEMEGIFLLDENSGIFMSRWKEGAALTVNSAHFREWTPGLKPAEAIAQEHAAENAVKEHVTKESAVTEDIASVTEDIASEAEEAVLQGEQAAQGNRVAATEIPMKNIFPEYTWQEVWESLKAAHPVFAPFDNETILCVRIEIKDLRELPKRYWYFGNNSFLLHGFFNYHYLVVGKTDTNRWFLGVPGIYQRQERVMAAIFGFPDFMPAAVRREHENENGASDEREKEKECNRQGEPVNQFGYWFRYVEEL